MKTTPSWHSVWTIVLIAVGMVVSAEVATAGESSERSENFRAARRAAPRADRGPDRDADVRRRPHDAVSQPNPEDRHGQPPKGPLPEIARRMLAGSPMELFSDVVAKFLSDVAVKLFSGNKAELLSGNEAQLLSGNKPELLSGNEAELLSGNETELLSGNETELLSGNHAQILSGNAVTLSSGNQISITLNNSGNGNVGSKTANTWNN